MIADDAKYTRLAKCAERIYKFFQQDKGFFSGFEEVNHKRVPTFNKYNGAVQAIENKLGRVLTRDEQTILALAVGDGPTPSMTPIERRSALSDLWEGKANTELACIPYDRLLKFL